MQNPGNETTSLIDFDDQVKNHPVYAFEYNTLCSYLVGAVSNIETVEQFNSEKTSLIKLLHHTLKKATVLYDVNHDYLIVPREAKKLGADIIALQNLLTALGEGDRVPPKIIEHTAVDVLSVTVRSATPVYNFPRTLLARVIRLLNMIATALKNSNDFKIIAGLVNTLFSHFINFLSFTFFLPRLVINLFCLAKHTIPRHWINGKEKDIMFSSRFLAQLKRRWFEIGNDIVWISLGILNCFILVGTLAPILPYVTLAAFIYDVFATSIRLYTEIKNLKQFQAKLDTSELHPKDAIKYREHTMFNIELEKERLLLAVLSTTALAIAMIICLPPLVISSVIPIIAASLLVAITVLTYIANQAIERKRPNKDITSLSAPHSAFFKLVSQQSRSSVNHNNPSPVQHSI